MKVYYSGKSSSIDLKRLMKEQIGRNELDVQEDITSRDDCDVLLYIVDATMNNLGDVIDVVNDSNHHPNKTIFCFSGETVKDKNFNDHQVKSLNAIGKMVERNGAKWFPDIDLVLEHLKKLSLIGN